MTGSRTLTVRREASPATLRSAVVRFVWAVLLGVAGVLGLAGAAAADPGDGPFDVAVSPDGLFAYVANRGSDTVSRIALLNNSVTARIPVGEWPAAVAIAPDGSFALVANAGSGTVSRIRTSDNKVVATIALGDLGDWSFSSAPKALAISPTGSVAYVAYGYKVVPIRLADNAVLPGFSSPHHYPVSIAFAPSGSFAYVGLSGDSAPVDGELIRVRTSDNSIQAVVPLANPAARLTFAPNGTRAFMTAYPDHISAEVRDIDLATNTVSAPIAGWQGSPLAISPDGTFGYLAQKDTNLVQVVRMSDRKVLGTVTVGKWPEAVAFGPTGAFALVPNYGSDSVTRLDLPGQPTAAKATVGKTTAKVTFTAPSVPAGNPPITNYMYSFDAGKTWVTRSPASAATTIDLASLTTGKTYSLVTRAVSAHGFGLVSALVSFVPALPPAAPTALVATPGYASATVKFAAPGDNGGAPITGYEVSVNGGAWKAASPSGTSSPKTVMGLVNGTQTSIRLRAVNAAGPGAASAAVTVNPTGAPAAPTNVKAVPTDKGAWIGFTPPASNGGGAIVRYEYSLDYGAHWTTPVGGTTTSPMLITGLTNGTAYGIRIRAANAVSIGTASAAVTVAPSADPQPTVFVPVSPARVIDTRVVNGGAGPIKAKSTRMFSVRTTQKDGLPVVPAGATAVAINLTVPNPTKSGYLGLPTDAVTPPSAAAITFRAGETIANGITTTLTPARSIYLYAAVDAEAAVDVLGYYIPAALAGSAGDHGKFTAITPVRAYSSLVDPQGALAPTAPNQPPRTIKLATSQAGAPILPAGATSVAYNITVVKPDQAGHLRVMPGNQQSSAASAINWATKGDTIANGLVVNVDGAGAINVANWSAGKVNFLVDVVGYYSASGTQFYPLTSARVLDTRLSQGGAGPILAGNDGVRIAYVSTTQNSWQPVVPAGAKAISYNLTVTGPSTGGHLRVWPSNAPLVDASVLNWPAAGYTRSNGTMVAISDQRQVRVYLGSGKADAIIDVLGYYR